MIQSAKTRLKLQSKIYNYWNMDAAVKQLLAMVKSELQTNKLKPICLWHIQVR